MIDRTEELQLVFQAKEDLEAFGKLYELYVKKIYNYVSYLVGNNDIAEDIVSQTFEKAMLNIDRYEDRGYSFGAWLYRIARNLVYDRSRKKKDTSLDEIEIYIKSEEDGPLDETEKDEEAQRLKQIIGKLKPEQREIIYLRYLSEYSIKEVCEMTGRSEDSVKSLAKRGLKRLRELSKNQTINYGRE